MSDPRAAKKAARLARAFTNFPTQSGEAMNPSSIIRTLVALQQWTDDAVLNVKPSFTAVAHSIVTTANEKATPA